MSVVVDACHTMLFPTGKPQWKHLENGLAIIIREGIKEMSVKASSFANITLQDSLIHTHTHTHIHTLEVVIKHVLVKAQKTMVQLLIT